MVHTPPVFRPLATAALATFVSAAPAAAQQPSERPAQAAEGAQGPAASKSPRSQETRVLDQLVAVVEKQPIMLSELEFEARVALINKGGTEAVDAELSEDVLASIADYVVGQKVAFLEAERLQVFAVDDAEVLKARAELVARFPHEKAYRDFLDGHEASEEQLLAILRRDLRVARFIESKVKLMARVTEAELRRFYDSHGEDFAGQPFTKVREGIRTLLLRERYQDLARSQLEQLRARSDVRLVAAFARSRIRPPVTSTDGRLPHHTDIESDDDSGELSP